MKSKLLLIFCLVNSILFTTNLFAQREVKGKVTSENGDTLIGVAVKVKNLEITAITDKDGNFKIWLPKSVKTLEFSDYNGMKVREVNIINQNEVNLILAAESKEFDLFDLSLDELLKIEIVSAGKTEEKVSEIPASVIILQRKDIENYGFTSTMELLQHVSGFYLIDGYNSNLGSPGVRGFWSDDPNLGPITILVNNIYQLESLLVLPIQAIDRIEIIRGPMSVIYGSGSFFGAINIVTNIDEENIASFSYGSDNTLNTFARLSGGTENFKYSLNVGFERNDGINVKYRDLMGDANFSAFQDLETSFRETIPDDFSTEKHFEKEQKYLNFYGHLKDFYLSASLISNYYEYFRLFPAFEKGTNIKTDYGGITLGYKKEILSSFLLNVKASYHNTSVFWGYNFFNHLFYGNSYNNYSIFEGELDLDYSPSEKINIVVGGKYNTLINSNSVIDIPSSGDPTLTNYAIRFIKSGGTIAGFTQVNFSPLKNMKIIGGIRFEKVNEITLEYFTNGASIDPNFPPTKLEETTEGSDLIIIPRAALVYALRDNHIVKLMYGEATQIQGEFDPKKQKTAELNYLYTKDKYSIGLNVFRNNFENLIDVKYVFQPATSQYTIEYTNTGSMSTNGIEFSIIAKPLKDLKVELDATYQQTENKNDKDIDVSYSPNLLGQIKVLYQFGKFSFGLTGYYVDEMESLWIAENLITNEPAHRIGDKASNHFIVGANVRINNIYKGLFVNLRVSNIFDTEIRYPTVQSTSPFAKGTLGQKRFVFGTVGWKFYTIVYLQN